MIVMPGGGTPVGLTGTSHVSGASASFTHAPMSSWTQRLDSPIGQQFLKAISDKTGLSVSDITAQLKGGTTLHDILQSHGVTFAQIRQAVRGQGGVAAAGRHAHHQQGADAVAASQFLQALAGKLNLEPAQLRDQLQSGVGLEQIATNQGVSQDALVTDIHDALQSVGLYQSSGAQAPTDVPPTLVSGVV
jgi:uncharacterized protein (DUF433 family)